MSAPDLGGLVEGVLALHQPKDRWNGLGRAVEMGCSSCWAAADTPWPCRTVRLVAEATGSPVPEPRMTPRDADWAEPLARDGYVDISAMRAETAARGEAFHG